MHETAPYADKGGHPPHKQKQDYVMDFTLYR